MPSPEALLEPATPVAPPVRAAVRGVGMALPDRVVTNAEVGARAGVDDAWIRRRTGIAARRQAAAEDSAAGLAADAARAALEDAGIAPADVDLVVVATMTPDLATPQVAPVVAERIGAHGAGAFDVAAACTAWLSALAAASALIETGRARCAVVAGVDVLSRLLDPEDRTTAPLFGDGAGAAVLGTGAGGGRVGPVVLGSDGAAAGHITCPLGGPIAMDGHATFQRAVAAMAAASSEVCARAGVPLGTVDLVVPHQANARIVAAVGERLGVPSERLVDVIRDTGNTSAATIPIALTLARRAGRLPASGHVLLCAFGAGLTWGAALLDWEEPA